MSSGAASSRPAALAGEIADLLHDPAASVLAEAAGPAAFAERMRSQERRRRCNEGVLDIDRWDVEVLGDRAGAVAGPKAVDEVFHVGAP